MKQQVNFSQFIDAFRDYGRHDQFTYQAKRALFDWIEEMDDDCGTESELDVVALCCEFSEIEEDDKEYQDRSVGIYKYRSQCHDRRRRQERSSTGIP